MSCGFCVFFFFSFHLEDMICEMKNGSWFLKPCLCPLEKRVLIPLLWPGPILCKILPRERAIDCEHNGHAGMMTPRLLSLNPHLVSETQLPMSLGPRCSLYWKVFLSRLLPGCIFSSLRSQVQGYLFKEACFDHPHLNLHPGFPPKLYFSPCMFL